jgi:oligopeptide/dipeptide ABC transporter ATP-binding protein
MPDSQSRSPIPDDSAVLTATGVSIGFTSREGRVDAVRNVSIALRRGETVGILGESGSGKSTLALSFLGLLPANGHVLGGSIRVGNLEVVGATDAELRDLRGKRIGVVLQDSSSALNPLLPIGTQITEVMTFHLGVSRREAVDRATALLAEVGVTEPRRRLDQYPFQLSGGLRQRVALAVALAADPEILVADEPTTALDVTVQAQLLDLLRREQERRAMAIVLITHDHGVVAQTCHRVNVMYAGRIVESGATSDVLSRPRHPYTLGLRESVPRLDRPLTARLPSIPGSPPSLVDLPSGCPFAPRCRFVVERCISEDPQLLPSAGHPPDHFAACWVEQGMVS